MIKKNFVLFCGALCAIAASALTYALPTPNVDTVVITDVTTPDESTGYITIQGKVDPAFGITTIGINGYATTSFDGKNFTVIMPPAADYQINIYDAQGNYQALFYSAMSQPVDSAIQVVVGEQLTQDLGPVLGTLLTNLDLGNALGIGADECVVDTFLLAGCDLYIRQLSLNGMPQVELSLSPVDRQELTANIHMDIPQAVLSTQLKSLIFPGYRDTTITTEDISVDVQIGIKPTADQSIKLVLDSPSDIELSIGSMRVQSNRLSPYLIPLFKDTIAQFIDRHLASIVGPFLNLLPIPAIPIDLPIDLDGDNVDDAQFAINMGAQVLDVLSGNEGLAVLGGTIGSSTIAEGRNVIGSRRLGTALPAPQTVTAPTDINTSVAVDTVNQVLTAVYQSGLDEKISLDLTVADLGDFGIILVNSFGYNFDDVVDIRLSLGSAPAALVNGASLYPLGLDASLAATRLVLSTPREQGDEIILDFTSDLLINTSLGAEADGSLHLEFEDLLTVSDTVINGGTLVDVFGFPPDILAFLLNAALPNLVANLQPVIDELLNAARLELDIGEVLSNWLDSEFPSVPVQAFITETGISDDETYINLGIGIDFN